VSEGGKNIAASVRQRLLNRAKADKRPFNELLQYYAMERFLYRLSQSAHAERFILKGALMLRVWQAPEARPTMDIDMLGKTDNSPDAIARQIAEILTTPVDDDGLQFDAASLQTETIKEDADYQGVRVRFIGELSGARINQQLDIGFGDALVPGAMRADFPTLLDHPVPNVLCYSRESAIAEKFEAMVKLGDLNSRMKDFYDIWLLSHQFDFDSALLAEAIRQTFNHRGTRLPEQLPFMGAFAALKQPQWRAFHKRLGMAHIPQEFGEITHALTEFLTVFLKTDDAMPAYYWQAPGPWRAQ
jgi:predicted nucleotidyltransferase component of viral defense system